MNALDKPNASHHHVDDVIPLAEFETKYIQPVYENMAKHFQDGQGTGHGEEYVEEKNWVEERVRGEAKPLQIIDPWLAVRTEGGNT